MERSRSVDMRLPSQLVLEIMNSNYEDGYWDRFDDVCRERFYICIQFGRGFESGIFGSFLAGSRRLNEGKLTVFQHIFTDFFFLMPSVFTKRRYCACK